MIGRGRERWGYVRSIKGKTVQRFFPWKDRELKRIFLSFLIDQTRRNRCNLMMWRYLDPATIPNCAVSHISEKFHGLSALEKWIRYLSDQRWTSRALKLHPSSYIYIYTHPPPAPIRPSVRNRAGNWPGFSRRSPLGDGPHYTCNRDTGRRPLGFAVSLCVSRCVKVC